MAWRSISRTHPRVVIFLGFVWPETDRQTEKIERGSGGRPGDVGFESMNFRRGFRI